VKKPTRKYLLLAVIALGTWVWFRSGDSDEKRIRKCFDRLAECVTKPSGEQSVMMAAKMHNLGNVFADTCYFECERAMMTGDYTPEEVSSHAVRARSLFGDVKLAFYDLNVLLSGEGRATATVTARLTGTMKSGESFQETHELDCVLAKCEDDWRINKVVVVQVLDK